MPLRPAIRNKQTKNYAFPRRAWERNSTVLKNTETPAQQTS